MSSKPNVKLSSMQCCQRNICAEACILILDYGVCGKLSASQQSSVTKISVYLTSFEPATYWLSDINANTSITPEQFGSVHYINSSALSSLLLRLHGVWVWHGYRDFFCLFLKKVGYPATWVGYPSITRTHTPCKRSMRLRSLPFGRQHYQIWPYWSLHESLLIKILNGTYQLVFPVAVS